MLPTAKVATNDLEAGLIHDAALAVSSLDPQTQQGLVCLAKGRQLVRTVSAPCNPRYFVQLDFGTGQGHGTTFAAARRGLPTHQGLACSSGGEPSMEQQQAPFTQQADANQQSLRAQTRHNLYLWLWTPVAVLALLLQVLFEVPGGAGAVWGCAELLGLRHGVQLSWQVAALVTGAICAWRFLVIHAPVGQDQSFLQEHPNFGTMVFREQLRAVSSKPWLFLRRCR